MVLETYKANLFQLRYALNPSKSCVDNLDLAIVREIAPKSIALQGGDTQTMNFNGSILANTCSADKELFHIYFIDEDEEVE